MNRLPTIDPVIRRKKTPAQREAYWELVKLTDEEINPEWFNNPVLLKRRDELVAILEPEPTEDELMEEYFAKRPGMKEKTLLLMARGATNTEIHKVTGVTTSKPFAYLRKKYGFVSRSKGLRNSEDSNGDLHE